VVKGRQSKVWILDESFDRIKDKRDAKQRDMQKYKELKKTVQRMLRIDKKKQLDNMCEELELANEKGNMRKLFQTVRTVTRKFQPRLHCIQSSTGDNITETGEIAELWPEYCEDLYSDEQQNTVYMQYEREPPPLRSEVVRALQQTADHKSVGPDDVPVELLKEGGDTTVDRMHKICTALLEMGEWPEDWTNSTFIPLPKKGDLKQCKNYRTIALVSHASKVLLRIILEWMRSKTESEIADEQAGFRRGRGTRDPVTNLRIILHKAREHQQPLFMCFVDFKKAFDSSHIRNSGSLC
jgi:hypothetical protein